MATGAPDYFKRILLYGLHHGEATPLACNSAGWLLAAVEELVDTLFYDDFEADLTRWLTGGSGTGHAATIDTTRSRSGALSCKLVPGSTSGYQSYIYHAEPLQDNQRWGFEFYWYTEDVPEKVLIYIDYRDGSQHYEFFFRWLSSDQSLWITDSGGAWVQVGTNAGVSDIWYTWNRMKLVLDFSLKSYVRAIFNEQTIDLSSYSVAASGAASDKAVNFEIINEHNDASQPVIYVDDCRITIDEP